MRDAHLVALFLACNLFSFSFFFLFSFCQTFVKTLVLDLLFSADLVLQWHLIIIVAHAPFSFVFSSYFQGSIRLIVNVVDFAAVTIAIAAMLRAFITGQPDSVKLAELAIQ